jgi:adenylylsulfate kinase
LGAVWINADAVREEYDDWDFSPEGRMRQAQRMKYLADGIIKAGKICVADFVCPTEQARAEFAADFTVWMDTIAEGRFADTNAMFQKPEHIDYHVSEWFNDTHLVLMEVIKKYMERGYHNV